MSYLTAYIAVSKCNCAIFNIYWLAIFIYFIFNGAYLIYAFMVMYEYIDNSFLIILTILYLVSTIAFVTVSNYYTKYLTSKKCDCVSDNYRYILNIISKIRLYTTLLTGIVLVPWVIYIVYQKTFVSRK